MGSRIAAAVVALAMVAGSLALRSNMDADKRAQREVLRLVCVPELQDVCAALEDDPATNIALTVEAAGVTADRLTALPDRSSPGLDGWLAIGNWPGMVDAERQAAGKRPLFPGSDGAPGAGVGTLAATRVSLVMWKDRSAAMAAKCGRVLSCLADLAAGGTWATAGGSTAWGRVKVALPDPGASALGLVSLAAVARSSFAGQPFGRSELQQDADFQRRAAGLAQSAASTDATLETMLAVGPALADAAFVLEATLKGPDLQGVPRLADADVLFLDPITTATVIYGITSGEPARRLQSAVTAIAPDALVSRGWSRDVRTIPANQQLPDGGVLAALRQTWRENFR